MLHTWLHDYMHACVSLVTCKHPEVHVGGFWMQVVYTSAACLQVHREHHLKHEAVLRVWPSLAGIHAGILPGEGCRRLPPACEQACMLDMMMM